MKKFLPSVDSLPGLMALVIISIALKGCQMINLEKRIKALEDNQSAERSSP